MVALFHLKEIFMKQILQLLLIAVAFVAALFISLGLFQFFSMVIEKLISLWNTLT
jgi:hypothetical protein